MQDDHYVGAILEEVRDQYKAINEGLQPLSRMANDIDQLKEDMVEVKTDLKAIKAVIKDQSRQLDDHETRITAIETT